MEINRRLFLQMAAFGLTGTLLSPFTAFGENTNTNEKEPIDVVIGNLVSVGDGWLEISQNNQTHRYKWNNSTTFWKGGEKSVNYLKQGDEVMLRILKDNGLIIRGWDNLSRVRGVVTRSQKGGFVLKQDPEKEVFIATNEETEFKNFYLDQRIAKENVNIIESDYIDAIGEVTSEGLYATLIYYGHPSDQSSYETKVTSGQVTKQKVNGISPLVICTYTYYGTATWFNCPVGAGRCGCKGTTNEIAWPAMDDCGCCNSKCADCSSGCKNQIRIQCGAAVIVEDLCNNRWKTFGVSDAGPCQKANCGGCSPQLCGRVCSDSLGYNTPIVDLTKVSFAAWYDPAKRGCFSCKASYMTPC